MSSSKFSRRLILGEQKSEAPDHTQGVLPQIWSGIEQIRAVTFMVLKAQVVVFVEGVVMEGWIVSITGFTPSTNKKRISAFGADRQWSCHVKRSPTHNRLRGKTSDTLYRNVADYFSFSAGY
ncbi:hypothetical protein TNCV_92171 [Trichonephila clavipes]|nr:hypothetical protein TNCV_92171 [Trichonephila clavipes]